MESEILKPMNISTGQSSGGGGSGNEVSIRQRRSGGMLLVIVSSIFIIFFLLSFLSSPSSSSSSTLLTHSIERPVNILNLLSLVTERGLESKSLIPIKKSESQVIEQLNLPVRATIFFSLFFSLYSFTFPLSPSSVSLLSLI